MAKVRRNYICVSAIFKAVPPEKQGKKLNLNSNAGQHTGHGFPLYFPSNNRSALGQPCALATEDAHRGGKRKKNANYSGVAVNSYSRSCVD